MLVADDEPMADINQVCYIFMNIWSCLS
jgi:hypothetical protein